MNVASVYKKVLLVNKFEDKVIQYIKEGKITVPVYLSKGQETVAAILSEFCQGWNIFTQHRAHDVYLCFGGDPKKLMDELMGLSTGTSGGKAGSNCIHAPEINMWGHHGLIGENVSIATGFAFGSWKPTLCIFGDGAAEEDYVGPSFGFAATHKLPILYVCVDNGLSVLTPKEVRRKWDIIEIATGYGIIPTSCNQFVLKDYMIYSINEALNKIITKLPALIHTSVCRKHWHVGTGIDSEPEWDTFKMLKEIYSNEIDFPKIEKEVDGLLYDI